MTPRVLTSAELRAQGGPKPDCMYVPRSFLEINLADLMEHARETFALEMTTAWSEQWEAIIAEKYPSLGAGIDPTQTVTGGERPGTAS